MNLQCPLPKLDFDIITLGHGSGGLLMHELLNKTILDIFKNDLLDQQHDGASFSLPGPLAFSTDSYVVSPIFFPGGNIGDLAVNGTVNDLAMCGAQAKYLSLAFILEEGLKVNAFWDVLVSIKNAAIKSGVQIVTGDTKVVEKGKGDKIFINTSGIGQVHPSAHIHHRYIEPGDVIILSGKLAAHGITIMSLRKGLQFETDIQTDSTNLNHTVMNLLDNFGDGIRFFRDPTRGGLASTLNEITSAAKIGMDIEQNCMPLDEQVEGACEMLGLDPLYVANEGLFVAIVKKGIAEEVLQLLHKDPNGTHAALIGNITVEHPGKVILKSRIGGKRVVSYLPGEQLPRIC
jgi:hydrogenase expression/formation protein HypE